jgi:hypothetical protein
LAGRDLDNVNRWRSQVGQPPVTEEEMAKLAQPVEIAGQPAQVFEQAGKMSQPMGNVPGSTGPTRILAAISRRDGVAWFFKMTGDDALVAQQKPAFVEFLKSLSFNPAPASASELPPNHPPIGGASAGNGGLLSAAGQPAPVAAGAEDKPAWQVPAGWEAVPGGQFLAAKFVIKGAGAAQAAVNVSTAPGDGGGVLGNVNRWRRQIGLGELPEGEMNKLVSPLDVGGSKAMLVDMAGTDPRTAQKTRLIGVIVPQAGRTWFYKLMGDESGRWLAEGPRSQSLPPAHVV